MSHLKPSGFSTLAEMLVLMSVLVILSACGKAGSFAGDTGFVKNQERSVNEVKTTENSGEGTGTEEVNPGPQYSENSQAKEQVIEVEGNPQGLPAEVSETEGGESQSDVDSPDEMPDIELTQMEQAADPAATLNCDKSADNPNIIKLSGDEDIKLTENSVVYLVLSGNATIELDADEVKKIKGLCIDATGGSGATIETDLVIDKMTYLGRGNASTSLKFGDSGYFNQISTDISGNHTLNISGSKVNCDLVQALTGGGAKVNCVKTL